MQRRVAMKRKRSLLARSLFTVALAVGAIVSMIQSPQCSQAQAKPRREAAPQPPAGDRVQQYLGLAQATLARPITPAELEAAVLSPAGVNDIAALFEKSLASGLVLDGTVVTPELGGEATLDGGRLQFIEYPDPLQPLVRHMTEIEDDPKAPRRILTVRGAGYVFAKQQP